MKYKRKIVRLKDESKRRESENGKTKEKRSNKEQEITAEGGKEEYYKKDRKVSNKRFNYSC